MHNRLANGDTYLVMITEASLIELDVHQRVIVIYIYMQFHEIPSSGYLVYGSGRTDDGRTDGRREGLTDGRTWRNYIPPPSAGKKCLVLLLIPHPTRQKNFFLPSGFL